MNNGSYQKRTGILGGTFNPIHNGHIILAQNAMKICGLDNVIFIPSGCSYLKNPSGIAGKEHRLKMTQLAVNEHKGFSVSDIEIKREGNSYTYKTLEELKKIEPDTQLFFIVGADTFLFMENWKEPESVFSQCTVACAGRSGHSAKEINDKADLFRTEYEADVIIMDVPNTDVSSSKVRQLLANGEDCSAYLDPKVIKYIKDNRLYGNDRN
jgi:nicotinate-nucleotide adenylyltransferase